MRITSQGRIGIGTTNPDARLHVDGSDSSSKIIHTVGRYTASGSTYGYQPILYHQSYGPNSYNNISAEIGIQPIYNGAWVEGPAAKMSFKLNNTASDSNGWGPIPNVEVMTLTGWGGVGIGTTSPYAKLHIASANLYASGGQTVSETMFITGYTGQGGNVMGHYGGYIQGGNIVEQQTYLSLGTYHQQGGAVEHMRIADTGRIGIGTATPDSHVKLDVRSAGGGVSGDNWISGCFGVNDDTKPRVVVGTLSGKATIGGHNGVLNAWDDLCINPGSGNVGIGTAAPVCPLHVNGWASGASSAGLFTYFIAQGQESGNAYRTWTASIYASGSIIAGDAIVAIGAALTSDIRIKENIQPKKDILSIIDQINLYSYDHIDKKHGRVEIGVIAQEMRDILPSCVNSARGFLPNIYKIATSHTSIEGKVRIIVDNAVDVGEKVRLYIQSNQNKEVEHISNIYDCSSSYIVVDEWDNYSLDDKVFVYGIEDQNILNVDKVQLGLAALGGVKELSEIVKSQARTIGEHERTISEHERTINEQQQTITELEARLSRLESALSQLIR
jgi:hypothetical protein